MRKAGTILILLLAAWVLLTAGLYAAMLQSPDRFGQIMAHVPMPMMLVLPFETLWMSARAGQLERGAVAPDIHLPFLDHSRQFQLSDYRGRPVVLVFGSYT